MRAHSPPVGVSDQPIVFILVPGALLASCIVLFFQVINLCGVKWVMRLAMPIALASAGLAFLSAVIPIVSGSVDWQEAFGAAPESSRRR
jgi:hypothetical protein